MDFFQGDEGGEPFSAVRLVHKAINFPLVGFKALLLIILVVFLIY